MADVPSPETALAMMTIILACAAARLKMHWTGWWEGPIARLARRKRLAIVISFATPLLLRAMLLPLHGIPAPRIHDEYSFLLGADTLAHGRVVNPRHPHWVHFESMHILARPVYASAFPLGPAAALAVGRSVFGHPWAGVWLSVGLMCGAVCWMLQGWLPPRWALLGSVLLILRLGVSSYWINSYWGGALAAACGALVLGALPRIRSGDWRPAVVMGIGLAGLANTRPFEGAVLGLVVTVPLLLRIIRLKAVRCTAVPLGAVLLLTFVGMGYYFFRVTGSPLVAPYVLYRSTMTMAPHFLWQTPRPEPLYNNSEMRHFYVASEMHNYLTARRDLAGDLAKKVSSYWRFYLGPLLTLPLFALPAVWRSRKGRETILMAAAFLVFALPGQVWHNAHYAAPATGLMILIPMMCMRRLRLWRRRKDAMGLSMARCLPTACLGMLLIVAIAGRGGTKGEEVAGSSWRWPSAGGVLRARILQQLEHSSARHLVLVRYASSHDPGNEWVYNGADIDGEKVVWARELDRASNERLIRYFSGRRVWLVEADLPAPRMIAYSDAELRPMPFVQLSAPGIEVLRSPEELRRMLIRGGLHTCDAWNYLFTESTGVASPDPAAGCFSEENREELVAFEHWWGWMKRQK